MSSIPESAPEELPSGTQPEETASPEGESTQDSYRPSLAEAFAEAERQIFGRQADEEDEEQYGEQYGEHEEQPQPRPEPQIEQRQQRQASIESELDRIISHVKRGSLDALPPEIKGRVAALERELAQRVQEQSAQESQLKQEFLKLEALRIEDPEQFAEFIAESPDNAQIYHSLKAAFSNLTPDGEEFAKPPERVREETLVEVFSDMLTAVSEATGLRGRELDAVKAQSAGPWDFLQNAIRAAIERELASARQRIAREESQAAKQQMQAEIVSGNVVVPRDLPSYVPQGGAQGPIDIRTAAEIAERMLSR